MEITGKLILKLEPTKGTSSKGEWTKQDIILKLPKLTLKRFAFLL